MLFRKKKNDLLKFSALICSSDLTNCEKIQEQLHSSDKKGFNFCFYRIDTTRFAFEAKKMLRKKNYDLLIIDANMNKNPTIQIIANAKKGNPNLKALVLTPILNIEIKQWRKVGSIDGFQLTPYQLLPFLTNVSNIINGFDDTLKEVSKNKVSDLNTTITDDALIQKNNEENIGTSTNQNRIEESINEELEIFL